MWLGFGEHTIQDNVCPIDLQISQNHTVPYQGSPSWWDLPMEMPEWLRKKVIIVLCNVGVCEHEHRQEDWQIPAS